MLKISRREYKTPLEHRLFNERKAAVPHFCEELRAVARRLNKVKYDGEFHRTKKRVITFLDTRDHTIALNRLVFRQRDDVEKHRTEYTLKCRSPDRYIAAGADLQAEAGLEAQSKFEEDITAPFIVRFSQSNTVAASDNTPETLEQAARLFPALGRLRRDGEPCDPALKLRPVSSMSAFERVYEGPTLRFDGLEATVALILWSDGPDGRPLVGEFSFRYASDREDYSPRAARIAMECFEEIQRLDWCAPGGRTKTQYAYRD